MTTAAPTPNNTPAPAAAPAPAPAGTPNPGTTPPAAGTPGGAAAPAPAAAGTPASGTPAGAAPTTYADFTMPQGVEFDAAALTEFKAFAQANGLSQSQAQAILDGRAKEIQASQAAAEQEWTQQLKTWEAEFRNDAEFGGTNYDQSVQTADVGIKKFGSPAFQKLLQDSGLQKHPEVLRTFARIGKLLREDVPGGLPQGGGNSAQTQTVEQRAVAAMYGTSK